MAKKGKGKAPTKTCPSCGAVMHSRKAKCDSCGHEFVPASRRKRVVRKKRPAARVARPAGASTLRSQLLEERARLQRRLEAINLLLESEK